MRPTALMREWIEDGLVAEAPDDAVVSVGVLRHMLAAAVTVHERTGT